NSQRYFSIVLEVRFFRITAIVGESTTTQACVISPDGEWLHVELSIDYNSSSHVIAKLDHNKTFEKPTSVERFNGSINMDGDDIVVRLTVDLTSPKSDFCTWDGRYFMKCSVTMNDTMQTRKSNGSRISITGAAPTLIVNPDIYERFTRQGLNHICKTVHTGGIQSEKYLEIQVYRPNHTTGFRYSKKIPESEKEFNSENNITYINITGSTARFLLVSDFTSNNSCNNIQTITFLLDRPIEFDKGIVKCVLRDDNFEYAYAAEIISVIPDEYCFGYEDIPKRNHPNNDCFYFVNCFEDGGRMYAIGDNCRTPGKCMDFSLGYCVDCHENFTCKGPEPITTTTTLAPGKTYVQCSDVSQKEGLPIIINCTVLDDTFQSLIVTLTSSSNGNKEKKIGVILPDGTIQNQARSSPVLNTTFSVGSKYIHFVIGSSSCMEEGKYSLTNTNVSMDTQPSISAFFFDNLVPLKGLTINSESLYKEGKPLKFNCTATVDSDHTELLGYYKLPSDSSYVKVQGEQTILQTFSQNCTKSVLSRFDTGLIVSANLNGTKLKCLYNEISPEASEEKHVKIQSADVAFNTYKLKAEVQSKANFTCLVRSTGSYKAIKILKIINSTSMIKMASYTPSSDSVQSVAGVDANISSNALTLIFASVKCSDEGQYNCTVIMDDDSEEQPPLSLNIQVTTLPGSSTVELFVDPDIVEGRFSPFHYCLGSVGYPDVGGYLEITFVHPLTSENITLNKESLRTTSRDEMEIESTLMPYIKEDCKTLEKISFKIKPSRKWNRGKIVCEVKSNNESVQKATKEEVLYVIDASFCNATNNQEIYLDHEKKDFCNTYVQCSRGNPYGKRCPPNLCVFIGEAYCDDCFRVKCTEDVTSTEPTTDLVTETTTITTPTTTQLGSQYLSCTSIFVNEGETATISCVLNITSFDYISISNSKGSILSVFANTTVMYTENRSAAKFECTVTGTALAFAIKTVQCNDSVEYEFELYSEGILSSSVTASVLMKTKPLSPELTISYRLEMGKNQPIHTCKGYVGNPKGTLELEIKNTTSGNFSKYIPTTQSFGFSVLENCNNQLVLTFSIDLTIDNLSDHYLRCLAKDTKTLPDSDPIPMSNEVPIVPLEANPCSGIIGFFIHPRDCRYYIQCNNNNIGHIFNCESKCFNLTSSQC
ncbi:uncharacterized protein LOC134239550, partial [Saccostrea cucullata]|uniref:uncharacterized protein LOC134239550 n=1 Tax=Saccostrea cuccullata TaxID=36930 RepID=UPI002ED43215